MKEIVWIIVVYVGGLAAMLVEMFMPGAVIGIAGFLAVCGSIVYAFVSGHVVAGGILTAMTVAFVPLFFLVWRGVLGRFWASKIDEKGFRPSTIIDESLLGKEGETISQLRPSGTALIEGRRYAVVTRGELIERRTRVSVIDVSGNRVIVKKT